VFGPDLGERVLPDRDLTIIGRSVASGLSAESPLAGLPVPRKTRYLVGLAHGSVERSDIPPQFTMIGAAEIARSGLDYLGLGDWHSAQDVSSGGVAAWYSGAPEMLGLDEGTAGHVLLVTLEAPGRTAVERRRVGRRRIEFLVLDAATVGGHDAVERTIRERANPDLALLITITGLAGLTDRVDVDRLHVDLGPEFFRLQIRDESHLRPEGIDPSQFPENTVLGRFVRQMHEQIAGRRGEERDIAEEALAYGAALLEGKIALS